MGVKTLKDLKQSIVPGVILRKYIVFTLRKKDNQLKIACFGCLFLSQLLLFFLFIFFLSLCFPNLIHLLILCILLVKFQILIFSNSYSMHLQFKQSWGKGLNIIIRIWHYNSTNYIETPFININNFLYHMRICTTFTLQGLKFV